MRWTMPLLCLILLPWPPRESRPPSPVVTVSTDTAAYCAELAGRVRAPASAEAATGEALCAAGHIRGGVMHLRRALLLQAGLLQREP